MSTAEFYCKLPGRKVKVQDYPERIHFSENIWWFLLQKNYFVVAHIFQKTKISVNLLAETLKQRLSSSSSLHSMWCCPGTRAQLLWAWPHTPSSAQALSRWDRVSPAGHCWSLTANYRYKIKGLALGFRQQFGFCIKLPQPKQDDVKSLLGVSKSFLVTLSSCNDPSSLFEGASLCLQVCPSAPGNAEMWSRI